MHFNKFRGVLPATLAVFKADGGLDEEGLRKHLSHVGRIEGVNSIAVNGHAGEMTSLSRGERATILRIAREATAPEVGVLAGIWSEDTAGACELAEDAHAAGADAILLFPPAIFANGANLRPEMALRFVGEVAKRGRLPLVLFQLSVSSGMGYSCELLARLCREIDAIVAIKEGSDIPRVVETNLRAIRAIPRPISVLTTNNTWLMASLSLGVDGILSGMGSVVATLLVTLFDAVNANDWPLARRVNDRLFPLTEVLYRAPGIDAHSRMKVALHLLGMLPNAVVRSPLCPLPSSEIADIRNALETAGLTKKDLALAT